MTKDYYQTLGVPRTASQDDIKKAFRRLAAEHHPDKGGDAAKFKEVNTAHQVLTDEAKKARYDLWGNEDAHGPPPPPRPSPGRRQPNIRFDVEDFDSVFRNVRDPFGPFSAGFSRNARPAPAPGADVSVKVTVTMEEALAGTKRNVRFDKGESRPCTKCARTRHNVTICPLCSGNGRIIDMIGGNPSVRQCTTCRGAGNVPLDRCDVCRGTGTETVQREITVTVPKGLRSGQEMRIKGHGKAGTPPGDLHIKVVVEDSATWWARGGELFHAMEVPLHEVLRGGPVRVRVPDGRDLTVEMPAGGGFSRTPGVWKNPGGEEDGALTVIFRIAGTAGLSARGERLLRELADEAGQARPR